MARLILRWHTWRLAVLERRLKKLEERIKELRRQSPYSQRLNAIEQRRYSVLASYNTHWQFLHNLQR